MDHRTAAGADPRADLPAVASDVHIEAGPARVWPLVTDIALPARFSPELQAVRWLDGAEGPAPGARFEGRNRNDLLGEWRTVSYVVELDPPRVFAWAVLDPDGRFGPPADDPASPLATWRFTLTPEAAGVRLRLGALLGPGRSGLTAAIERRPDKREAIIRHRLADLRTGIEATLNGVKELAERPDRRRTVG